MKTDTFILQWIEKGKKYEKKVNKQEFFNVMESIKNAFTDDNEISSKFIEIIPVLISITIDKDRNEQKDVPSIYCRCEDKPRMIDIIRYHKIIWAILNRYCKEE